MPGEDDGAPVNRYATFQDLAAVEHRLTTKIEQIGNRGWQLATIAMAAVAVIASLAPHINFQ